VFQANTLLDTQLPMRAGKSPLLRGSEVWKMYQAAVCTPL